jgi:hypothetical protein
MAVLAPSPASAKEAPTRTTAKVSKPSGATNGATKKSPTPSHVIPAGVTVNACGCYRTEVGTCFCGDKNGKCACPGECEPIACEQKRSKEIQREIAAETKKVQDEEKKRLAEEASAQAAALAAAQAAAGPDAALVSDEATEPTDETAAKKADQLKNDKSEGVARKPRKRVAKP